VDLGGLLLGGIGQELDLVELVDPQQTPGVAARRTGKLMPWLSLDANPPKWLAPPVIKISSNSKPWRPSKENTVVRNWAIKGSSAVFNT